MLKLNLTEEKISFDGKKVICVPVFLELPMAFKVIFFCFSVLKNYIMNFFHLSQFLNLIPPDNALTTDTPTPCNPPETLYES